MERHTYSQPHSDFAPDDTDDLLGDSDAEDRHQQNQQQHQRSSGGNGGGGGGGGMSQAGRVLVMAAVTAVFLAVLAFYLGDPLSLYYAAGDESDPLGVGAAADGAKGNAAEQVLDALVSAIDEQESKRAESSADSHSEQDARLEGADGDGGTGGPVGSAINSSTSAAEAELMSLRSKRLKRQAEAQQAARQSLQRVFDELAEMGAPGVDENGRKDKQKDMDGGKGKDGVGEKKGG